MEPWILVLLVGALGAVLWWLFRRPPGQPREARGRRGAGKRLAQRALDAATHGLKLSTEDPTLVERFDFAPFRRGAERRATEVLQGVDNGDEVTAFHYSFALEGEERRREYEVTTLAASFGWVGRLRLTSLERTPGAEPSFDEAWRVEEEPPGTDLLTPEVRKMLMAKRLQASAIVVGPDVIVIIDTPRNQPPDLGDDLAFLRGLRRKLALA